MSASWVFLTPLALLAILLLLSFVGCANGWGEFAVPFTHYQSTVQGTGGLVAYWPLNETSSTTAVDFGPNGGSPQAFNGIYTPGANVPYDAADQSAAATGAVNLNESGIVPGDQVSNTASPCPYFDGGFVIVPWDLELNPNPPFTLEAWVRPHWSANDVQNFPAFRAVAASADAAGTSKGFVLSATPDNFWAVAVGTGSGFVEAKPGAGSNQTILADTTYYLVVTYDGTTLNLWVNPADTSAGPYAQAAASGYVGPASPIPFFIGTGVSNTNTPLFPFNGWIQDVAFYNVLLDGHTIEAHFMNGNAIQRM